MLLSGIGKPYDPETQKGVIGKNYATRAAPASTLFFEDKAFNPFIATGGSDVTIDDFHTNWTFDRGPHGFVGGLHRRRRLRHGRPIGYRPVPPRHAAMGLGVEGGDARSGTRRR